MILSQDFDELLLFIAEMQTVGHCHHVGEIKMITQDFGQFTQPLTGQIILKGFIQAEMTKVNLFTV